MGDTALSGVTVYAFGERVCKLRLSSSSMKDNSNAHTYNISSDPFPSSLPIVPASFWSSETSYINVDISSIRLVLNSVCENKNATIFKFTSSFYVLDLRPNSFQDLPSQLVQ